MCFAVRLGVDNVPNKIKETETNVNSLQTFSILLADTVCVDSRGYRVVAGLRARFVPALELRELFEPCVNGVQYGVVECIF